MRSSSCTARCTGVTSRCALNEQSPGMIRRSGFDVTLGEGAVAESVEAAAGAYSGTAPAG